MRRTNGDHAVVLGGGMAGLLAARVLAEAYGRVTVVDRDRMPGAGQHRRGVPQGRHVHGLLARGQQIMEELFPGLTADLLGQGALAGDLLGDCRWYLNGHRLARTRVGLTALCARRPLLEGAVRARVFGRANVTLREGHDIVGLTTTPDGRRVTGARIMDRSADGAVENLAADVVVDATGRGSRLPSWLERLGYDAPPEERIRIRLAYATRVYRLTAEMLDGDLILINGPTREQLRGGLVQRVGRDTALATLTGRLGDIPPTDPDGFLSFAGSLPVPDIHRALRSAQPLGDPVPFRFPESVWRRYDRLRRLPAGLLVIGDAVCCLNPQYAQGMSVAALETLVLREHVSAGEPDPRAVLRDVARVIDAPWKVSAGADLALPGVEGRRTPVGRLMNRYVTRLHATAASDAGVAASFVRVAGLVDPPQRLLRPALVRRVLRRTGGARPATATGRRTDPVTSSTAD